MTISMISLLISRSSINRAGRLIFRISNLEQRSQRRAKPGDHLPEHARWDLVGSSHQTTGGDPRSAPTPQRGDSGGQQGGPRLPTRETSTTSEWGVHLHEHFRPLEPRPTTGLAATESTKPHTSSNSGPYRLNPEPQTPPLSRYLKPESRHPNFSAFLSLGRGESSGLSYAMLPRLVI